MKPRDFDSEAHGFDERAGLGDEMAAKVAAAVLGIVRPQPHHAIVEIGAGTGEIGRHFAAAPVCYIALDASEGMLGRFRSQHALRENRSLLVVADCDQRWPIADGSIRCVFASRVIHLLDGGHLMAELTRLAQDRMHLLIGRTLRDPAGYKEELRTLMQAALARRGIDPNDGRMRSKNHLERWIAAGAKRIDGVEVARWVTRGSPIDVLRSWDAKPDLAGVAVDAEVRRAVLAEVEESATREFGDIEQERDSIETYVIVGGVWTKQPSTG